MLNTVTTQGWNAAHFAAQGGDVRILQLLADKGTSLTKTTYDRKTILHIACMFSRFEMCNHILSQYPNMQNVVDKFGWNAAHFAAQEGDVRILRLLSDKGVPITEITFDHLTILHIACKHAKYEMCQHILSKSPELLNLLSTRGWTAAHYAAEGGDIRILQLLSDKGVPVTETTYDNRTILHNACACAKYEMCEYILSQYPDMPNVVSTLGWTAAHCATQGGDVRFLQLLADKGVPLTGATYANQTILHFACSNAKYEMCQHILSQYPYILNVVDRYGWNAAHFAAQGGDVRILQLLADKGVPVTETTYDNGTILHNACACAKYEMCEYILSKYHDMPNVVSTLGWTAAHCAAQGGDVRILQLLSDKGVPVTETTYGNSTILHIACCNAKYEMCEYILSQYPDILNAVNTRGWNAAHYAAQGGDIRILQLLSDKGVPLTGATYDNKTILHIACRHAKYAMCQHILSQYPDILNVVDTYGWNAAHFAAQGGDIRILQLLSDKGVPNIETTYDNSTILHIACMFAKYEMCQHILSKSPELQNLLNTRGWNAAHCAAQGGDIRILQLLSDKGVPLTGATYDNKTILHIACRHAKYAMCQHILSKYPDILNVVDTYGWNAAHFAAQGGDIRILQLLSDKGVPNIETTYDNSTILHIACMFAKYEMCQHILSKSPELQNLLNARGWTAAHYAAEGGDIRILQLLSDKGVPVTETTYDNLSILHLACFYAKYKFCEYTLSQYPDMLNVVNTLGYNAAHCAAQGGDIRILQLLADKGVPLTGATYENETILHIACAHAKYAMCQQILSQYPEILNDVTKQGLNAAHCAAQGGDVRILNLLADKGVPLTGTTYDNGTILHFACCNAKYEMCQYILSHHSNMLDDVNTQGWNAAHCAAQGGDVRILQLLSDKGVPITETTFDHLTILHIACSSAKYEMCQHILSQYPNLIHSMDITGKNAAHFAIQGGNTRILQLLTQKGVRLNACSENE
ncbi:ankyrin-3-like [Saccostrea cucullata]|uniref:ankyrin-3-like n=1 Tax=Saccostrea cuccullata TaxID=36930 RepID=UPI002ED68737